MWTIPPQILPCLVTVGCVKLTGKADYNGYVTWETPVYQELLISGLGSPKSSCCFVLFCFSFPQHWGLNLESARGWESALLSCILKYCLYFLFWDRISLCCQNCLALTHSGRPWMYSFSALVFQIVGTAELCHQAPFYIFLTYVLHECDFLYSGFSQSSHLLVV